MKKRLVFNPQPPFDLQPSLGYITRDLERGPGEGWQGGGGVGKPKYFLEKSIHGCLKYFLEEKRQKGGLQKVARNDDLDYY
jgi:hypothetical protein